MEEIKVGDIVVYKKDESYVNERTGKEVTVFKVNVGLIRKISDEQSFEGNRKIYKTDGGVDLDRSDIVEKVITKNVEVPSATK